MRPGAESAGKTPDRAWLSGGGDSGYYEQCGTVNADGFPTILEDQIKKRSG